jgi:excisionase family DNA binding protein
VISVEGEEFLTVNEAARRLGVKVATLYAYVSRGRLTSYRQGMKRRRLYRRADIERLLELAPSAVELAGPRRAPARRVPDIPLAESWIRD